MYTHGGQPNDVGVSFCWLCYACCDWQLLDLHQEFWKETCSLVRLMSPSQPQAEPQPQYCQRALCSAGQQCSAARQAAQIALCCKHHATGGLLSNCLNQIPTGFSPQHSYQLMQAFSTCCTTVLSVLWTCVLSHTGTYC
jgi:hypothetical protein